ncbi:MAG: response regulator [Bdellovibrionaceae bacterium]|nr:response regulator [Bdellovibrionales bacterium]MCB9084003.1 response regulator [Pseudobdellovibrionaceae bacterium]
MRLSPTEERLLFDMICNLTGAAYEEDFRREMIMNNIGFRMQNLKIPNLKGYLERIERDEGEFDHLISLSTIHTTAWFREKGHFDFLYKLAMSCDNHALSPLRLWFSACSTGQEVYTAGMVLERVRQHRPSFEYRILGSDIDVISLNYARQAIYPTRKISEVPNEFQEFVLEGSGKTDGLFTIAKEIRDRTAFRRIDLNQVEEANLDKFDVIACRNVLIYFKSPKVHSIVGNQQKYLKEGGHFIVGHCEAVEAGDYGLKSLGGSVYRRESEKKEKEKWVLVVDDSPTYRRFLVKQLEAWGFGTVQAASAAEAEAAIHQRKFDLITLDLHMPDRSGGDWIEDVRKRNIRTPVVIVSEAHPKEAFKVVEVLERDSVEFLDKVTVSGRPDVLKLTAEGITRQAEMVKKGRTGDTGRVSLGLRKSAVPDAILIGASTGGPQALTRILRNWPKPSPPVVVVQHISKNFLQAFAERLAQVSGLELGDPAHDPVLKENHVYLALDDYHLHIGRGSEQLTIRPYKGDARHGHRPSVDELFLSSVPHGHRVCSVILTGMGADGAKGMVELRKAGALTFGQDEESCVVYGMPKEAFNNGGVEHVGDVEFIRQSLLDLIALPSKKAAG